MRHFLSSLSIILTVTIYSAVASADTIKITEEQINLIYPDKRPEIEIYTLGGSIIETESASDFSGPLFELRNQKVDLMTLSNYILINKSGEIKYLNIARNDLYTLDNIDKLTKLVGLGIINGGVKSKRLLPPPSLKHLSVGITDITEISPPPSTLSMEVHSDVTQLPCFSQLPKLERAYIGYTAIDKLTIGKEPHKSLKKLKYLYNKKHTDILDINQFPNLEDAFIRDVTPVVPEDISSLVHLKKLTIESPMVNKTLKLPKNIEHLDYTCKNCEKAPDLSSLNNITYARLVGPEYTEIPTFPTPEKLLELHLEDTNITEITGLEKFPNLKKLSIDRSKITKIGNLDKAPQLEYLSLKGNQITKIENLKSLTKLDTLDLEDNPIATLDFKEIEHLAGVLIKLYGTPYDQNISNEDYRRLLNLASQKRKTSN